MNILIIKDEIRELMARYVRHADEKNWQQLAALFTPGGSFTPLDVSGQLIIELQGREQIAQTINSSVGEATAIHHLFSYEIQLDNESTAKGVFAMEDYLIRPESQKRTHETTGTLPDFRTMHGFGHYHASFVKTGGSWQIEKLVQTRVKLDFTY
jgi:hypothetical protein